jgi:hypothetical protein
MVHTEGEINMDLLELLKGFSSLVERRSLRNWRKGILIDGEVEPGIRIVARYRENGRICRKFVFSRILDSATY